MLTITLEKKEGSVTKKDSLKIKNELLPLSEVFDGFIYLLTGIGYTQEEITCEINELRLDCIRENELKGIISQCQRK